MVKLIKFIKDNGSKMVVFLIFIAAVVAVALLLPQERKFTLEYFKGQPWNHETYVAKFDFTIQKTEQQLEQEKDSILANLEPYFTFNAFLYGENLAAFKDDFNKMWVAYAMREFRIDEEYKYHESNRYQSVRALQTKYQDLIFGLLEKSYIKGIVQIPDIFNFEFREESDINIIRGSIVEKRPFSSLLTMKSAYENIKLKLNNEIAADRSRQLPRFSEFFKDYNINKYIEANIIYDKEATDREKENRIQSISMDVGYVSAGDLVIAKGEYVTQETFQILESLKYAYEKQSGNVSTLWVRSGRVLLTLVLFTVVFLFLYNFRREILEDAVKTSFILFMIVLMMVLATTASKFDYIHFYIVPFVILPIILRTFYDERVALFIHTVTVLMAGFMASNRFEFVFITIIAGMVAIFTLTNLYRRSKLFISSVLVIVAYSVSYFGLSVIQEGSFSQISWDAFQYFGINGVLILLSFGLIYLFEKTFGFVSDTTLMELSDTNQPLLRKLAEMAPATFQHSLQVANLAEEATIVLGGNPLLVRTGALYHDIGKMIDSQYFTENQMGGYNPHSSKDYKDSARIIINHVTAGYEMARKNNLPEIVADFITTHHGTSTTKYFLKSFQNENPTKVVDEKDFMYPGPKPLSKENAVLMMADSVEAASRSLPEYNKETISELVDRIINIQISEGQFEEADITYRDISTVKKVFKARLEIIYHARIAYPK